MVQTSAIFLDRDGTLIRDTGYIGDPDLVEFVPGVFHALQMFQNAGYRLVIVSNQSGIGRELITESEYEQVQSRIISLLREEGIQVSAAYYCPHAPIARCVCRKPLPYLLLQAARDLEIDLGQSFMVGDKLSDVEAGSAAGCTTILFRPTEGSGEAQESGLDTAAPDYICADWQSVARVIGSRQ